MIWKMKSIALIAAALLCMVLVVGSSPIASAAQHSRSASSRALKSPIPIGLIGSWSGPEASSLDSGRTAVKAWVKYTNHHGGLAGHRIKLYDENDNTTASTALTEVHTLVQQDHVVAIVGEQSDLDSVWASYIQSTGIPVVGGLPLDTVFATNSDFFPSGTNFAAQTYGQLSLARQYGTKLAVFYCVEAPQCKQAATADGPLGKKLGLQIVTSQGISGTAPSYAAQCADITSLGAQSYFILDPQAVVQKFDGECKQAGVKAQLVENDGTITSVSVTDPNEQGELGLELDVPFSVDSTPATKAFHNAIKKYEPRAASTIGPSAMYGWTAGQLLVAAVKASHKSTITPTSIKAGLYKLNHTTLGGLAPPLTFHKNKPTTGIDCYFVMKISHDKLITPDGIKPKCPSASGKKIISQYIASVASAS